MIVYGRTKHRPGQPNPPDPKGIGWVEWMLGSGSGPIFGSALIRVGFGSNPTQPIFLKKKHTHTHTTNVSDKQNYG